MDTTLHSLVLQDGKDGENEKEKSARGPVEGERGKGGEGDAFDTSHAAFSGNHSVRNAAARRSNGTPKLSSARTVLSSRLESGSFKGDPATTGESQGTSDVTKPESGQLGAPDPSLDSTVDGHRGGGGEGAGERASERGAAEEVGAGGGGEGAGKSTWRARDGKKERWKVRRRERLAGSMETPAEEEGSEKTEREEAVIRLGGGGIRRRTENEGGSKEWGDAERDGERQAGGRETEGGGAEEDAETKGVIPHPILSRMLIHSSASSSSSFNCSSPESDEVFSEGEETADRRKNMRRVSGPDQSV